MHVIRLLKAIGCIPRLLVKKVKINCRLAFLSPEHDNTHSIVIYTKFFSYWVCFRFIWDRGKCSMKRKTKSPNQHPNLLICSAIQCIMHFYFWIIFSNHLTADLWHMTKPARLVSNLSTSNQQFKIHLIYSTASLYSIYMNRILFWSKIHENVNYYFTLEAFQCIAITVAV